MFDLIGTLKKPSNFKSTFGYFFKYKKSENLEFFVYFIKTVTKVKIKI